MSYHLVTTRCCETTLAKNIDELMYQRDMSVGFLSEKSEVSRATIFKIFAGKVSPCLDTVERIAKVLGVKTGQLVDGTYPREGFKEREIG